MVTLYLSVKQLHPIPLDVFIGATATSAFFVFSLSFFLPPLSIIIGANTCSPGEPSLNTFVLFDKS